MKIGFIGAGKVGTSLGKYLVEHNVQVMGYYSQTYTSAIDAATFTNSKAYETIESLVNDVNTIFITVPDDDIHNVWEQLKALSISNKVISHFSGSLSSKVFTDIEDYHAFGYSIHPLYAVNSKFHSHKKLSEAFFTIEGHDTFQKHLVNLFKTFGNDVAVIQAEDKMLYHAAAAVVSNLYVGIVSLGERMLTRSGFTNEQAHEALKPLIRGNTDNILSYGPEDALTGPIERNDWLTVHNHVKTLNKEEKEIYQVLSNLIVDLAEKKHKNRDYGKIRGILKNEEHSDIFSKTEK